MFNSKIKLELETSRAENAMFRQVLDSLKSEMLHLTLTSSGIVEEVNPWFEKETGLSAKNIVGQNFKSLVPSRSRSSNHYQQMCEAIDAHRHWSGAVEIENDKVYWIRVILQPVFDVHGHCISIDIFGNNLTRTIETSRENENMISPTKPLRTNPY